MYGFTQRGSFADEIHFSTSARLHPTRVLRRRDPLFDLGLELFDGHARKRDREQFFEIRFRQLGDRLPVAGEYGLERLDILEFGLLGHNRRHAIQAVDDLAVHRVFHPQGAVLIEGGDPLWGGTKVLLPSLVVSVTNSTMARLAVVSFQDGKGSDWPRAPLQAKKIDRAATASTARPLRAKLR